MCAGSDSAFVFPQFLAYSQAMELLTADEIHHLSPPERLALIAQLSRAVSNTSNFLRPVRSKRNLNAA
jgi:hypothetical protein